MFTGTNPSRPGGFPATNSPGPVADLYGPSSQDSSVGNYISAASPQPGPGFGPSITVSSQTLTLYRLSAPLLLRHSALKLDTKPLPLLLITRLDDAPLNMTKCSQQYNINV